MIYEPELVERARRSPWWWSMADNPPCVPWCETQHDPNEFRVEGALTCERGFGSTITAAYSGRTAHVVEVAGMWTADEDVPFAVCGPVLHLRLAGSLEDLAAEGALELAAALTEAASFMQSEANR